MLHENLEGRHLYLLPQIFEMQPWNETACAGSLMQTRVVAFTRLQGSKMTEHPPNIDRYSHVDWQQLERV